VRPSTTVQTQHFSISISDQAGGLLSSEYRFSLTDCGIDFSGFERGFYLLRVMDEASQQVSVPKLAQPFCPLHGFISCYVRSNSQAFYAFAVRVIRAGLFLAEAISFLWFKEWEVLRYTAICRNGCGLRSCPPAAGLGRGRMTELPTEPLLHIALLL
jgi:hypothetical protein